FVGLPEAGEDGAGTRDEILAVAHGRHLCTPAARGQAFSVFPVKRPSGGHAPNSGRLAGARRGQRGGHTRVCRRTMIERPRAASPSGTRPSSSRGPTGHRPSTPPGGSLTTSRPPARRK